MSPTEPPHRPVSDVGNRSQLLPVLGFAIAVLIYLGWTERETLADWWDGDDPSLHYGPSKATGKLISIFSTDDYPMAAIRNEESGTVAVRFAIDRRGGVGSCEVIQSSGSDTLDEATCEIIEDRGYFEPARDAAGRRVEDEGTARIRWELPSE